MSAYIVEDETINKIGDGIHTFRLSQGFLLEKLGASDYATLGEMLFQMNVDGVNARYGEEKAEDFRPLNYEYKSTLPHKTIQFYASLSCFMYQCLEGEVPETTLYKAMDGIKNQLAHFIVYSLPQYKTTKWA